MFNPQRWDGAHGYRHDAVCYIPAEYERPTIIVEGPMDALAAAGCGFPAIAILGATPPKLVFDQVARLVDKSYRKGQAIIIPDNDRLGAWVDTQLELGNRGVYARIQQITNGAKDLAELPEQDRMEFLNA